MKIRQLILPVTIITLSTFALLLLIIDPFPLTSSQPVTEIVSAEAAIDHPPRLVRSSAKADTATDPIPVPTASDEPSAGRKRLEIFGRIVDPDGQPIEDVVIAEERYFAKTRSGADGHYRLRLELPRHRYPVLHFLRSGYAGQLIKLGQADLQQRRSHHLDVKMNPARNSVDLRGWIGNDLGLGLEGARIELSASQARDRDSYYLTAFSDEKGFFEFTGVRAGETYGLSATLSPEFTRFEQDALVVTQDPAPVNIVLKPLEFVDIDGMVVNRAGTPIGDYEIVVTNITTGKHSRKIISDSSGFFSLDRFPPGNIQLTTHGHEQYRIDGMAISTDPYQNLQIVVDRGSHQLSGWISDESGVGVDRAMVTVDRRFRRGKVEYSSYRSQSTGRDGKFVFDSLGDGEHRVTVYSWGYEKQDFNYRFDGQAGEIFVSLRRVAN